MVSSAFDPTEMFLDPIADFDGLHLECVLLNRFGEDKKWELPNATNFLSEIHFLFAERPPDKFSSLYQVRGGVGASVARPSHKRLISKILITTKADSEMKFATAMAHDVPISLLMTREEC